ncbi:hypothetical protein QBC40DRAFT_273618 [Triangularia verruculosa]|uniref:Uncharacterized protein n=1 Tax=Triangularia verruculosa TaxID=2587418 RepID=A0AAN6XSU8_9PEZI|nr:hypothetical protein QBC40DRAFT_273618 [Triangularia verruculosa]
MVDTDLERRPVVPFDAAPAARLTEDALRQHTLEYMRQDGIPPEELSEKPRSLRESALERAEAERKANGRLELDELQPPTTTTGRIRRLQSESHQQSQEEGEEKIKEVLEKDFTPFERAPTPATTIYTGNWKRETEYEDLQNEFREATKRNLDIHPYKNKPLSDSQDFLSEPASVRNELVWDGTEPSGKSKTSHSEFLSDLPPHEVVDNFSELGMYMSQASYVISLGGAALPDLKYGIIIVPAGDESLLFKGYGDHADMPVDFRAEIYAKSREVRKQVFAEELELCGRHIPRPGRGAEDFRLPPMEEPEKLFYAQRVKARRAKHIELYGTKRSSDFEPEADGVPEVESLSDQYSMPVSRSFSSANYVRSDYAALPPSSEVLDDLRRLFAQGGQEPRDQGEQELYHPDRLFELARYLGKLAEGRVRENPGLDEEVWNKINELRPEGQDTLAEATNEARTSSSEKT